MQRSVIFVGALLVALGLGVFAWKTRALDMPIIPSGEGPWRVELEITLRGEGQRGSVRAPLPSSGPGQSVFDERTASEGLLFTIRTEDGQRIGVWSGRLSGVVRVVHGFRVQTNAVRVPLPLTLPQEPPREILAAYTAATTELPVHAAEIQAEIARLPLASPRDPVARVRTLFTLVSEEIGGAVTGSDDAVLTLAAREGSPRGRTLLFTTLLRAAGIPARVVQGLALRGSNAVPVQWSEAWIDERWVPLSPVDGFFAERPEGLVALHTGEGAGITATGSEAIGWRYHALRESLRQEELAAMMVPPNPLLARLSLYRLPVPTQRALRAVLLLPLGALIVAFFRNGVGVETFGTFMPVLVAFALREASLVRGLSMVAIIVLLAILLRLLLERLRLLLVPRLSVLLCVVVLGITGMALTGTFAGGELYSAVLLPMVILTMFVERFTLVMAEEGLRQALIRAAWTTLVAVAVYPIFHSTLAEHLMFGFPELVFVVIGVLVWMGGYTGYRLLDLLRFRAFAQSPEKAV
jgi:transglutaminase-like putative cysteine protease